MENNENKSGFARALISVLAVLGLITAVVIAVDLIYKKYRKCLKGLNEEDTLEGLDEECFREDPVETGVDCDFAEA